MQMTTRGNASRSQFLVRHSRFDGVKLDRCGKQLNVTLYAGLMKATGKNFTIENCHWARPNASWSLRRALLMLQVHPGSLYRSGKSN